MVINSAPEYFSINPKKTSIKAITVAPNAILGGKGLLPLVGLRKSMKTTAKRPSCKMVDAVIATQKLIGKKMAVK